MAAGPHRARSVGSVFLPVFACRLPAAGRAAPAEAVDLSPTPAGSPRCPPAPPTSRLLGTRGTCQTTREASLRRCGSWRSESYGRRTRPAAGGSSSRRGPRPRTRRPSPRSPPRASRAGCCRRSPPCQPPRSPRGCPSRGRAAGGGPSAAPSPSRWEGYWAPTNTGSSGPWRSSRPSGAADAPPPAAEAATASALRGNGGWWGTCFPRLPPAPEPPLLCLPSPGDVEEAELLRLRSGPSVSPPPASWGTRTPTPCGTSRA